MSVPSSSRIAIAERWFFWLCLGLIITLHVVLMMNVGAFWRDEASSLLLAQRPTWSLMYHNLVYDSFPALWVTILRIWMLVSHEDDWIRLLGFVMSMGVIAALLSNSQRAKAPLPLLALALLAFNPAVFYWGDSIRAYSLALLLIVLFFGAVWSFCEAGKRLDLFQAVLLAVLASQSNYQNSYLIFAICTAGAVVCGLRHFWLRSVLILGTGFIAAVSMLPYWAVVTAYTKNIPTMNGAPVTVALLWQRFNECFVGTWGIPLTVLCILFAGCVVLPVYLWVCFGSAQSDEEKGANFRWALYAGITATFSVVGLIIFAKRVGLPTMSWYYIPILGVIGCSAELSGRMCLGFPYGRIARLVIAAVLVVTSLPVLWFQANLRRTNIDLMVDAITSKATPDDLVMVVPFWFSPSFEYYYKGSAPWTIFPLVPEKMEQANMVTVMMEKENPILETFDRMEKILKSGGRIWFVRGLPLQTYHGDPPPWQPAPFYGTEGSAYTSVWWVQTICFLQQHAVSVQHLKISMEETEKVSPLEAIDHVSVVEGWKP